jgi:hypothetical protein
MKPKCPDEFEGWKSRRGPSYVKILIVCLAVVILVSIPLVPILAFAIMARMLSGFFEAFAASLNAFMQSMLLAAVWIAFAIQVLLISDWGQIARLLPVWIGWLLSVDLLW